MRSLLFLTAVLAVACGGTSSAPPPTTPAPSGSANTGDPAQPGSCIATGCSGTVCAEPGKEVMTTCEYRAEYACYPSATCEKQADGTCGWTQTAELTACLANPPPLSPSAAPR
jgi:eight-cysteine-cluster-containing protein